MFTLLVSYSVSMLQVENLLTSVLIYRRKSTTILVENCLLQVEKYIFPHLSHNLTLLIEQIKQYIKLFILITNFKQIPTKAS